MFIDKTNLVYPEGSVYQPASFHRMYPKCFKRFPVCSLSPQHSLTPWPLEIIQRDIIAEQALGNLTVISKRARRHSRRNSRLNSAATAPVLSAQSYVSFLCIPLYLLYGHTPGKVMPLWKDTLPSILSAAGRCTRCKYVCRLCLYRLALKLKKTAGEKLLSLCTCFSASDVHGAGEAGSKRVNHCHLLLLMSCFKVRRWPNARVSNHFLLFMSYFGATTGQSVSELISA